MLRLDYVQKSLEEFILDSKPLAILKIYTTSTQRVKDMLYTNCSE
jgi:hypothetical protein